MVTHLLDTNTCIYILNKQPPNVLERFEQLEPGNVGISTITVAELAYGIRKSKSSKNQARLEQFLLALTIIPFDLEAVWKYGEIRNALEQKGTPIGPLDTLIAAHAMSLEVTLVTNNLKEFARVEDLSLENWVN